MSLERVIEVGRRQGMPVIVTDVGGREPMVLLPLNAYERLLDAPSESPALLVDAGPPTPPPARRDQGEGRSIREQNPQPSKKQPHAPPTPPPIRPPVQPQPVTPPPGQDGLRVRQRDEDRVQALHRSLDAVAETPSPSSSLSRPTAEGLLPEESFLFQE